MNGTWYEDKRSRSIDFYRTFCIPTCTCAACSGSGVYDNHGSPACGACAGTGTVRGYYRSVEEAVAILEKTSLRHDLQQRPRMEKRKENAARLATRMEAQPRAWLAVREIR